MIDMEDNSVCVSFDRGTVTARIYSAEAFDKYKKCRNEKKKFYENELVEMPAATVTPDGYYCIVRNKRSLKERICGEESIDIYGFATFMRSLGGLIKLCIAFDVPCRDVLFDYNCVFTKDGGKNFSFLYLPGAKDTRNANGPYELVNIAFMNMDTEHVDKCFYTELKGIIESLADYRDVSVFADVCGEVVSQIEDWEVKNNSFAWKIKRHFLPKNKAKSKTDKNYVEVFEKSAEDDSKKLIYECEFEDGEPKIIKIGRDAEWADINIESIFVSRKHAEIDFSASGRMTVRNLSLNGISVDNEMIEVSKEIDLSDNGTSISLVNLCELVVFARKIPA